MGSLWKELKYAFYLTVHPFNGLWDIKHEKRGSLKTALVLLVFFILSSVANGLFAGYMFNSDGGINYNIYKSVAMILLVYALWCITNWCLTSLFDGEGTFVDICKFTSYALLPLSIAQVVMIPLSHTLTLQEASFYTMIYNIGLIWTGLLLFLGVVVTHQYSVLKAIVITAVTLLGMCIIVSIMLLFLNLIQQILGFALTFWRELSLRLT